MGTYVTDGGFQKKTLAEIKNEREELYKSIFGNDIDLNSEGPFGQIIGIESQAEANLWDLAEEIYLSRDPDQATGVSLTKIARETGTERQGSEPTIVNDAILYGDNLTTIPVGVKAYRNTDSSTNPTTFSLTDTVVIDLTEAKELQLNIPDDIVPGQNYDVTMDSILYRRTATDDAAGFFLSGDASGNLSNFTAPLTDGEFGISLDGASSISVTGIDFTGDVTFNDVAATIESAIQGADASLTSVTVTYSSGSFTITSPTIGSTSSISITTTGGSGTDLLDPLYFNGGASVQGTDLDTKNSVIDALVALIDAVTDFNSQNLGEILYIFYAGLSFNVSYSSNFEIEKLGSIGDFQADTDGPIPVPANTLTEIINPVSGWDSVNNPNAGVQGSDEESDESLRIRRIEELTSGKATDNAIKTEVSNVEDVIGTFIISNRTDSTDSGGRPPHSFSVVVSGGANNNIAQAIFDTQPSGIQSFGTESGVAQDEDLQNYTIYFSRPTSIYIWVRVSRDFNTEESYPVDGDDQIKDAILEYASEFITIGTDIIRQRLATPVYSVPGVGDIIIELAETATPGGTPTYAEDNILVDASESPEFDVSRIIVQDIP
jgi:uncharacterized phage protein gp47/JayE